MTICLLLMLLLYGAQWLKSSPCMHWDPIWALVLILAALLLLQLLTYCLGKQSRMAQSHGTLYPHGRPEEAPGFWLWIGAALAVVAAWGVDHWWNIFLSVSPLICIYAFPIKKIFVKVTKWHFYPKAGECCISVAWTSFWSGLMHFLKALP